MHNIVLVINYDRGSNPNTTRTILCYVSLNTEAAGSLTPQSICTPSFPSDTGTDSWHREMKERSSLLILLSFGSTRAVFANCFVDLMHSRKPELNFLWVHTKLVDCWSASKYRYSNLYCGMITEYVLAKETYSLLRQTANT